MKRYTLFRSRAGHQSSAENEDRSFFVFPRGAEMGYNKQWNEAVEDTREMHRINVEVLRYGHEGIDKEIRRTYGRRTV